MGDTVDRIAWLLRTNRLLGGDRSWSRAGRFAAAFRGGSWPTAASESRISRWETGVVRPPTAAIARYEELLALRPGTLTSTVDLLWRYSAGRGEAVRWAAAPRVPPPVGADPTAGEERLEDLLERAASTASMSGPQWTELSRLVVARPGLMVFPRSYRSRVMERLVRETIISHDLSWRQRFEALNRLLGHPSCGPAAVAALASLGADRENQIFIETISVLDASRHPDAGRVVLAQLTDPTNDRALCGALLACERKIRFVHFAPEQLDVIADVVRDLLTDPAHADDARVLASLLSRRGYRFPGVGRGHLPPRPGAGLSGLSGPPVTGHGGRPLSPADAATATRVARATVALLGDEPAPALFAVFVGLVAELLFDPLSDTRMYATMLVAATPFGVPLARVLADELDPARTERLTRNVRLVTALRVLGGAEQRPVVEGIVTAPRLPSELSAAACFAIGHLGGVSDRRFWGAALRRHVDAWRRTRDAAAFTAVTGLVYSLGVSGQQGYLRRLRDAPGLPDPARRAATWWLDIPEHVRVSVTH
ncbi:hypothetical protein O7606_13160 [Micromonospora sp. WMMD882]|uniref:hypothetical protein n=1 Tax=Micromonospora sp. WMMD882 TaxID=3015151 RepID=UPI00248C967C|nr:hypothetical protein [Micromonospora sp. WMMD882]WBB77251.1 hypothetical protein O7606_13160 [Micromonospora sp. WMMD882]